MSDRVVLGIDPGNEGALAWVTREGNLIEIADMPIIEVNGRKKICAQTLAKLFETRPVDMIIIERVSAMKGWGISGCFWFGYGAGMVEGLAAGMGMPIRMITPASWKKKAQVPTDKNGARQMASRLWPGASDQFKRVKDDGRAEAALLARWAARTAEI